MEGNHDEIMYGLFDSNDSFSAEEDDVDFQSNPTHNQEDQDRQSSFQTLSNPIGNSGNTLDVPMELSIGTMFATFDSLSTAYQDYAKQVGFSVIIRTIKKINDMDKYAQLVCDRSRKSSTHKISKKTGCPAKLNAIKKDDGSWYVSSVVNEHNHTLDPNFSILMPGHRRLTVHMKRQLEANDIAGIRPCKNVRLLEVQSGGPMNLGCIPKDCRNYIEERRRLRLGDGDAEAIRKTFARMQLKDRNFYHLMDIDNEGRLRNVLWIHPRSRAAYEDFHDVVSFDTTYLVNRYKMPFAVMVGVNHHGQSILLGCSLVTTEDTDSFRWLFSNWLDAMGGVHPHAIITDQCESQKKALSEIMPDTIHRYCIWHIMSKLQQKFCRVANYHDAIAEFKYVVYECLTIQLFETKWAKFIEKFNLQNNQWLQGLYNERDKWVPVYLNNNFWAGMISTQRSEGMHAYFDEFVHSRSTLKTFMEQYEMAISSKIQKETFADFESQYKEVKLESNFPWEVQFQKAYTNSIYKQFQEEIKRMLYCHPGEGPDGCPWHFIDENGTETFRILERSIVHNYYLKEFTYTVEYRPNGAYFNCNCRKFEFKGILCCHILKIMAQKNVQSVNERYLLRRWRKDVYRRHSSIFLLAGILI